MHIIEAVVGISSISHCISAILKTKIHLVAAFPCEERSGRGKARGRITLSARLKGTLRKEDRADPTPHHYPPPLPPPHSRSKRRSAPLSPAGSSGGRLDSIRHLFYFFLFLFFNLAARERSGLVIDAAVSKPETRWGVEWGGDHSLCHGFPKTIFLSRLIYV